MRHVRGYSEFHALALIGPPFAITISCSVLLCIEHCKVRIDYAYLDIYIYSYIKSTTYDTVSKIKLTIAPIV